MRRIELAQTVQSLNTCLRVVQVPDMKQELIEGALLEACCLVKVSCADCYRIKRQLIAFCIGWWKRVRIEPNNL